MIVNHISFRKSFSKMKNLLEKNGRKHQLDLDTEFRMEPK